jgi:concanavalin A-like lectin/glucanase superfamily protein
MLEAIHNQTIRALSLATLAVAIATTSARAQTPAALWTLDQGSGTTATDTSGNNRNATLTSTTWTSPGKVGAFCISGSGAGFGQATGAAINTASSFTAAAWVRLNTLGAFSGILSINGVNVSGFFLEYHSGLQRFSFARFASDSTGAAITTANATAAPVVGTWYHVAAVYNSSAQTMALYVNGVLQQSVSFTSPWQATGATQIGRTRYGGNPVSMFQGSIDDARLYQSALTQAQIQTLVNMGSGTPDFNLSASPNTISIAQGANGTRTITINRLNGFTGSVGFTASGMPSGVTAVFNPTPTTGNSSTLTLSVSGSTPTGNSTITVTGTSGSLVRTTPITLTVTTGGGGGFYTWPSYSPAISYDYVDEFGTFPPPTQVLNDCANVSGTYANGWWCFRYGPNRNSLVTSAAWTPMVARFNTDFAYITDTMRWPRDLRARSGFYSAIYLYGSGLCTDNAPNTATGGWQSAIFFNGQNWPMVLASYYPVYSYDPACPFSDRVFQMNAMVHEGIHCINASMPGCFNSAWFHEGGNTWLQANMEGKRTGNYGSMGFLSAGLAIAPFMPIECYSGWLQDGSFGGPSAQGVNRFVNGQQICTWRNLLGGTQYGECFPNALSVILGEKSIAWLWRYCSISGRVLQDLAQAPGGLGDTQMRRLISEFRGRQAFGDFGVWKTAYKLLLNNNWGITIDQEFSPFWIDCPAWTARCYVDTTVNGSTLTPNSLTLPGWSGANQIPLTVSGTSATVTFNPIGANMRCQLVYQEVNGTIRYSTPVSSGVCSIPLQNVKNNVIIAVICNTDYVYTGDAIRSQKYNYTLTMGSGVTGKAAIATQWYQ